MAAWALTGVRAHPGAATPQKARRVAAAPGIYQTAGYTSDGEATSRINKHVNYIEAVRTWQLRLLLLMLFLLWLLLRLLLRLLL